MKTYGFFFSKYFIKLTQKQYQKGAGLLRITLWSTYLTKAPSIGSRHNTKMAPAPEKDDGTNDQDDVQGLSIN